LIVPASSVYPDIVRLAGGPDRLTQLALEQIEAGKNVEALHITGIALSSKPSNRPSLEARLKALTALRERSHNTNERGWLDWSIQTTKAKLP
jgi:hypothetical protein